MIYHTSSESIWFSKNKEKIKVNKFRKEISSTSVDLIKKLFKTVIYETKFPETDLGGRDGINYYFTVSDFGQKTGTIWSPSKGTKMSRLVEIGNDLIKLVGSPEAVIRLDQIFIDKIESLIKAFV